MNIQDFYRLDCAFVAIPRTIVVSARKRDPKVVEIQKYDNRDSWNISGGLAPNGVCATRYLRHTTPRVSLLCPLAAWLVTYCPGYLAGKMPHTQFNCRVSVYNGRSKAEQILYEAKTSLAVGATHFADSGAAIKAAESLLAAYSGHLDSPHKINDWLFDIIEPIQTDERYWNLQASKMIAAGAVRVSIGEHFFDLAKLN